MRKRIAAAVLLALLTAFGRWAWQMRRIVRPRYDVQAVETRTFKAYYPAQWEKIDVRDPRLGDENIIFTNHRKQAEGEEYGPWDRPRMRLHLDDLGTGCSSLDEAVAAERKKTPGPGRIEALRLDNGVAAKTWTGTEPVAPDIPAEFRTIAFKGGNGHCYSAQYMVPADWRVRERYGYIFLRILGSLQFKTPARN